MKRVRSFCNWWKEVLRGPDSKLSVRRHMALLGFLMAAFISAGVGIEAHIGSKMADSYIAAAEHFFDGFLIFSAACLGLSVDLSSLRGKPTAQVTTTAPPTIQPTLPAK